MNNTLVPLKESSGIHIPGISPFIRRVEEENSKPEASESCSERKRRLTSTGLEMSPSPKKISNAEAKTGPPDHNSGQLLPLFFRTDTEGRLLDGPPMEGPTLESIVSPMRPKAPVVTSNPFPSPCPRCRQQEERGAIAHSHPLRFPPNTPTPYATNSLHRPMMLYPENPDQLPEWEMELLRAPMIPSPPDEKKPRLQQQQPEKCLSAFEI